MVVDLNPIVAALAALVLAITPALVLRLSGQVHEVKQLTNGRMSDLMKRVEELRAEVEQLKAGRRKQDLMGVASEPLVDTQPGGTPPGR